MLRNRLILVVVSIGLIIALFMLPKVVVQDQTQLTPADSALASVKDPHRTPEQLQQAINRLKLLVTPDVPPEKNAIFADSLAGLYAKAGKFDSAAWFSEKAAAFFNTIESWQKAGDAFYAAYTFATDQQKQNELAAKAQEFFTKVLAAQPDDLNVKTKLAMTYMSSANPMQGISLLREVLAADPKNEAALYNLGMLSVQSGQYQRAVERLTELTRVNPNHVQGQLLLGVAFLNMGDKKAARKQFEKVKQLDADPAVQATADSYLKDLE